MFPGPQFPTLGDGDRPPVFLPVGGAGVRAGPRPLRDALLHEEPSLGAGRRGPLSRWAGGAPARVISARKPRPALAGPLRAAARDMCWTRAFQAWSRHTKAWEEGGTKGFFTQQLKSRRLARSCCTGAGAGGRSRPCEPCSPASASPLSRVRGLHAQAPGASLTTTGRPHLCCPHAPGAPVHPQCTSHAPALCAPGLCCLTLPSQF